MYKILSEKSNRITVLKRAKMLSEADSAYLELCQTYFGWNEEFMRTQIDRVFGSYQDSMNMRMRKSIVAFTNEFIIDNISNVDFKRAVKEIKRIYT